MDNLSGIPSSNVLYILLYDTSRHFITHHDTPIALNTIIAANSIVIQTNQVPNVFNISFLDPFLTFPLYIVVLFTIPPT